MVYDKEIQKIFNKLEIFEHLYEHLRLVDPLRKKLLTYKNGVLNELDVNCYDIWDKDKLCMNCISMRSFNENKTFVKVEYSSGKIYMVTAMPIELSDRNIVIELFKDATSSMIFEDGNNGSESNVHSLIDNMNNLLLKDALTGIYNRRYINERLPVDIISSTISDESLSIIIADIDFFKKVNDTYGHLAGDAILIGFTSILSGCITGENDWIARYGGEEFLVCIHNSTPEKVADIAELMRKSVENNTFSYKDIDIKVTSSFGICNLDDIEDHNIFNFIDCADKKLYIAKNNGRNKVVS